MVRRYLGKIVRVQGGEGSVGPKATALSSNHIRAPTNMIQITSRIRVSGYIDSSGAGLVAWGLENIPFSEARV